MKHYLDKATILMEILNDPRKVILEADGPESEAMKIIKYLMYETGEVGFRSSNLLSISVPCNNEIEWQFLK